MSCVSIGANLGVYPLLLAAWSAPGGAVYAFEPNPTTATVLRDHVRMSDFGDRITVIEAAVADAPGVATLFAAGVDGMSRLGSANPLLRHTRPIEVRVETLDGYCTRQRIRPDVIVADVEGFEGAVLRGARSLFREGPPPICVVEMHPQAWAPAGTNRDSIARLLADLGVRPVPLTGQADPLADYGHVALEPVPVREAVRC
jgi:FkbM family methyltransferase